MFKSRPKISWLVVGLVFVFILAVGIQTNAAIWIGNTVGNWLGNNPSGQTDVDNAEHLFDRDGVPFLRIKEVGDIYHPGWIGLYALEYAGLETYDEEVAVGKDMEKFRACVGWLQLNLREKRGQWGWEYTFDSTYNDISVKAPWFSAFGQAAGIEALVASYELDGNTESLQIAEKAARVLFVPIEQDGLLYQNGDDIWFEEIAVPENNPSHILNGHMRALIAVKKLADATGNQEYQSWYERGLNTLEKWLPLYDTGYWLRYDLNPKKSELLFRFNNPYGFALPSLAIDSIALRDPISGQVCTLDVGASFDPEGALRIAGNDWDQQEMLDGRSVRRLKSIIPATAQEELSGELKSPGTYFYLQLPSDWTDNLRSADYELDIIYKDEASANLAVQMRSIAPGPAFRDIRDGDLLLTGSGQWRSWKIPLPTTDLGWWVGSSYAEKHAQYLNVMAEDRPLLEQWAQTAGGYLSLAEQFNEGMVVTKEIDKLLLPPQTPAVPVFSMDAEGVLMAHINDPDLGYDIPQYHVFNIAQQVIAIELFKNSTLFSYMDFGPGNIKREPALNWLLRSSSSRQVGGSSIYYYEFPNAYNDIYTPAHWQSAFSQAYVIKALNYALAEDLGDAATVRAQLERTVKGYEYAINEGGVVAPNRLQAHFAEEVPNATHVLNAHLVSTATLDEANQLLQSQSIANMTAEFRNILKDKLHGFDCGYWSRYDQNPKKELLFQLDWLSGEAAPLIDMIYLENPQTKTATVIDVGSAGDFESYPHLSGTDWLEIQEVDGRDARAFADGYKLHMAPVQGGSIHNVYFQGVLPERQFSDYFDVPVHRLVIKYKDIAPGEFVVKIQAINEGNFLAFIPLRGGLLRCIGDGQWKEAAFIVRPQDMGWYMGADYQQYHIEQLKVLAQQTGDWSFAQYAEKWQYFLDAHRDQKQVIIETN